MERRWSLQQLRLFEAVARLGSYTRAAEEQHLSQPAVHIQVKRLETAIGQPLIQAVGRKLLLTRAGDAVHAAAVDVINRLAGLAEALHEIDARVAGPLKVAAVTSAQVFLPQLLGRFVRTYPDVQPQLTVTNRERVIQRLLANDDDFVVMGQVPTPSDLTVIPFMDNRLVAVAAASHPLARHKRIRLERFAAERHLAREPGSGTRTAAEKLFATHGLTVQPYMTLGSNEAIKQAVVAGLGVSVLSQGSLELELATQRLAMLDVQGFPLHRTWNAVHLGGKRLGLTAQTFLDFLTAEGARAPT